MADGPVGDMPPIWLSETISGAAQPRSAATRPASNIKSTPTVPPAPSNGRASSQAYYSLHL